MSFSTLNLSDPILRAIRKQGYKTPTPIQAQAIPAILSGQDVLAKAQTGTGKTASFVLPILQQLATGTLARRPQVQALILAPTRELAAQVNDSIVAYGCHLPLRSMAVFGGVKIYPQIERLRRGIDILVATPGRLLDLLNRTTVDLSHTQTVVLDEADRMLDMGFIRDINKILLHLPKKRQSLLFSATFTQEIYRLTKNLLHKPIHIDVAPRNTAAETVEQRIYPVDQQRKSELLSQLIKKNNWWQVLIFTRTKYTADRLSRKLQQDQITASAIHSNKSQSNRTHTLAAFKQGKIQALVATDIAARGLDIEQLPQVINFELPNAAGDYVHRIGRTGRAGINGQAASLVCPDERKLLAGIERLLKRTLPHEIIPGFECEMRPLKPTVKKRRWSPGAKAKQMQQRKKSNYRQR